MKRDFNEWFGTFRNSISTYSYYVDFEKVIKNIDSIKIELNILNALIGEKDIENEFLRIVKNYPEVLKCIPILIAVRNYEINAQDSEGAFIYNFKKKNLTDEQYCMFMKKTGLFNLLQNHLVSNLVDYVTGVETGLDSNGRKNRGGHLMEDLVESHIVKMGFIKDVSYFKEIKSQTIENQWNIDLSNITNNGETTKRFDFAVVKDDRVYAIEANFYASSGSKLNETARSYKNIAINSQDIPNFSWRIVKSSATFLNNVLHMEFCIQDICVVLD